jgi:nucleobase transporter 1/2
MRNASVAPPGMIYGLDDRPPFGRALMLGAQHVLTMFGATVAVPLLLAPAMNLSPQQTGRLISAVMLASGAATLLQATIGSRLPIVQGMSFSFIAAYLSIISGVKDDGGGPQEMMQYIAGAILAGAVVEAVVGYSGLIGRLKRFLSPVVTGPVIMLIGLALFQHGAPKAGADWPTSGLTVVLVIVFSLVLGRQKTLFRIFPVLLALALVVTLCWLLSVAGVYRPGHPSYVDLTAARSAPWLRSRLDEILFPWGWPRFHAGFFFAILAGYLASIIESFGDYYACARLAAGRDPTPREISRGIGAEGIGCFLAGLVGGFSSTSYSENIGLVGLTKVGSRYVVQLGALILIALGFLGKFGALAAAIPGPVIGGIYCVMFGLIAAVGVQQLARCDLSSDRNLFIAGFTLFMGLSVPAWFSAVESRETIQPLQTLAMYRPTVETFLARLPAALADIVAAIGSTGMAVGAILGLLLDNLLPGKPQQAAP